MMTTITRITRIAGMTTMTGALLLFTGIGSSLGTGTGTCVWGPPALHASALVTTIAGASIAREQLIAPERSVQRLDRQLPLLDDPMTNPVRLQRMALEAPEPAQAPQVPLKPVLALTAPQGGARPDAQPPATRPPAAQDGFVPIDEIPDHDKLPAAPYLIGAYAVAWVAVLFYVWSLWGRLSRVEDELKRLSSGSTESSRP